MKTIATTKIEKVENDNNLRLWRSMEHAIMKRQVLLNLVLAVGLLAVCTAPFARLHRRKATRTFFLRLCSRRQEQRRARFRAQSMRFALLSIRLITTMAITRPARQKRSPRDQLGRREHRQRDHDDQWDPVRWLLGHSRRALHHGRHWVRPGATRGTSRRERVQQSDLRHYLQDV